MSVRSVVNWLMGRDTQEVKWEMPNALFFAMQTMVHMRNVARKPDTDEYTMGDALNESTTDYLSRNLWTNHIEDVKYVPQVVSREVSIAPDRKPSPSPTQPVRPR